MYCYTLCIGLAYFIAYGCGKHKKSKKFKEGEVLDAETQLKENIIWDKIFVSAIRDLSFFMLMLITYYIALSRNTLTRMICWFFMGIIGLYFVVVYFVEKWQLKKETALLENFKQQ